MRPLKLTMEAFGTFAEKQEIDFQQFEGIFLISGPTGSGKTTIFDAMTFSLYGSLPGTREITTVKSDYTGPESIAQVTFEFSVKGESWKVYRKPPQSRNALKGGGITSDPEQVALYKKKGEEWKAETGSRTTINKKIEDLINLSMDEFSKIILLPQGQFQKFLEADTDEKSTILEKVFPTDVYGRIAWRASEMASAIKRSQRSLSDQLKDLCTVFNNSTYKGDLEKLDVALKDFQEEKKNLDQSRIKLAGQIAEEKGLLADFESFDTAKFKRDEALAKQPGINELDETISLAEKVAPLMARLEQLEIKQKEHNEGTEELEKLRAKLEKSEETRKASEEALGKVPALEKEKKSADQEIGKLKMLLPKMEILKDCKTKLAARQNSLNTITKEEEEQKKSIKSIKEQLTGLDEKIDSCRNEAASAAEHQKKLGELKTVESRLIEYQKISDKIEKRNAEIRALGPELEKAEQIFETLETAAAELEKKREAAISAELASSLTPGSPCPVCGSHEHPSPALQEDGDDTGTKEELENARQAAVQAGKKLTTLKTRMEEKSGQKKEAEKELAPFIKDPVPDEKTIDREKTALTAALEQCRKNNDQVEIHKKTRSSQSAVLLKLEKENELALQKKITAGEEFSALKNEIEGLKKELAGNEDLEEKLKGLREKLGKLDREINALENADKQSRETSLTLKTTLDGHQKEIEKLETSLKRDREHFNESLTKQHFESAEEVRKWFLTSEEIGSRRKTVQDFHLSLEGLQESLKVLEKKIKDREKPDMGILESQKEKLETRLGELEKSEKEKDRERGTLTGHKERYEKLNEKLAEGLEESKHITVLADVLNGKNGRRLNFKNFVLGAYLKKVAAQASVRLHIMSNQRYTLNQLFREDVGRQGQFGLDLEVFDAHSGKNRSVKTLSGGEKFMAAISLALGMADVIQARSGGIELDSVFIDEGFGTLDDDTLQAALQILEDIKGERLVGIISHVGELKERIPDKILVEKGMAGSRVTVVAG